MIAACGEPRLIRDIGATCRDCPTPSSQARRRGGSSGHERPANGRRETETTDVREMDPTVSAAAAAPGHDGAGELGNLLVHLEGTRGYFSGSLIDYRMPCTASQDTRCQIVVSIPLWNEFLCWLELELRELSEVGSQLGLVHVRNICHMRPTHHQMRQAATLLYWLLKTHRCVSSVQIPNKTEDPEMANLCSVVLCNVLNGNDSVKSLALEISSPVQRERFCEVLLSMKCLGELHCAVFSLDETFPKTISALLRASATLTVLDFNAPLAGNVRLLLKALRANSTLRDLTLSSCAIWEEPELFVAFLSETVALKHLRVVGSPDLDCDNALEWIFEGMLKNETVSSLEMHEPVLNAENVKLGSRMLAQSKVLRSFSLLGCLFMGGEEEYGDPACWLEAISENDTLQYMTLSMGMWTRECWEQFFRLLSRHGSLKMVTIVADEYERRHLPNIARKLEEIGCGEKVSFVASCSDDRPCAAALDRVYRHPALVAELSRVLSISEADAVVAVRQGFRSIEGMHEFMRLAGVVKVRVTCQPREDGRAQLDALNEYCWSHVRRYLQLDDVAWHFRSSTNAM
ncbi:hypothetical protein HPB52_018585 [Rhipicephalus sanguineus]|uniref:Uncharacterized protein n=1 Tax=Rhipicephalus sanguineus TaxID=34632 RepID=A0A9D4SRD5_RHISA|nr:hypothetical protein HPB52_018585 [Rhipicephalus sanguineus]